MKEKNKDVEIGDYLAIGLGLGTSLGACTGSIADLITFNAGRYIAIGLSTGVAVGLSLSLLCFYMKTDKKKQSAKNNIK